jgi:hypothetical protein
VEEKQTKASFEGGIREGQPDSVNSIIVICSQAMVSTEGGIRKDQTHPAKEGKERSVIMSKQDVLKNQPPLITTIRVYTAQVYKAGSNNNLEKRATIRIPISSGLKIVLHTAFHSTRMISSLL